MIRQGEPKVTKTLYLQHKSYPRRFTVSEGTEKTFLQKSRRGESKEGAEE